MTHLLASPSFLLFELTFKAKVPNEQPTKSFTLDSYKSLPQFTCILYPFEVTMVSKFEMPSVIQNFSFELFFVHLSHISAWDIGKSQTSKNKSWVQLNWALNLEPNKVPGRQ